MSFLVIINDVVYDIINTSETSVCEKCAFVGSDVVCPRRQVKDDDIPFPLLVCTWLDDIEDGFHYFIKREV